MARNILLVLFSIFLIIYLGSCRALIFRKRPVQLYEQIAKSQKTFDAAIVPGIGFKGQWDSVMKGRILWAQFLYNKGIIKNIIFSGSAVYSPYYEAKIMGLYAQQLGIPSEHIFYETQAEHSTENIYYSYELARKLGFKTIALVTDPLQSYFTRGFTRRRFATPIYHIPFLVDTLRSFNSVDISIDPAPAFEPDFKSITERENGFKRFRGTLGAFIPWEHMQGRKANPL